MQQHRYRHVARGARTRVGRLGRYTAVVLVLLVSACGPDQNEQGTPPTTTTTTSAPAPTTTQPTPPDAATCSAQDARADAVPQPGVPRRVGTMRASIVAAARSCDYERLAELALAGEAPFTYSFGEEGEPAAFWRRAEERGEPVLRSLVHLLESPYGERATDATTQYVWPSAYAYDRWQDVPPEAREALRPLYDEADFARFEQQGSYLGYRVGITRAGDWIFFVAGD